MDISKDSVILHALPIETAVSVDSTVEQALKSLRKKPIERQIIYFYVVDHFNHLKGVVSTRQLLLSEPSTLIEKIMHLNVIQIRENETMKQAMLLFAKHPLLALPVVDKEQKLLGSIDVQMMLEEKINFQSANSRLEVFQLIGMNLDEEIDAPLFKSYRRRMPWLLCNVFSGLVCAVISRVYEGVLQKYLLFAFFIPLVLTLSESSSMQSMAQSLQFLRLPRFKWKAALERAKREWKLVWLLAISSAFLVGTISLFWKEGFLPSLTIGLGIMISISLSALFGLSIPFVLHRFKLDPKVAAGPVVLMIADMLTTALYLTLASFLLL